MQTQLIEKIYSHMGDSYSKEMYGYRLLYSTTGDTRWIEKVVSMTEEGQRFLNVLKENAGAEKIIFGTGTWGVGLLKTFPDYKWDFFADNFPKSDEKSGIPVISFDELSKNHRDSLIVIATRLYHKEILQQLLADGFRRENIINMGLMGDELSRRQYFDLAELPHEEEEVFVDCGCFDGMTSMFFAEWCQNRFSHIYAFEPDQENFIKCKKLLEDKFSPSSVDIFNCGLWNKAETLLFDAVSSGASKVTDQGKSQIQVKRLDDIIKGRVSFLKMDIEGSEYNALIGGGGIIKRCWPKMAISIYHKPEDMWEIPGLLLEYNPKYRFYLRHYSVAADETVLYAV